MDLPKPGRRELRELGFSEYERAIYRILYEHRGEPLTISQIRRLLGVQPGEQEHLNRRLRELYREFEVDRQRSGTATTYELKGRLAAPRRPRNRISKKDRAYVLRSHRCEQCGRTPAEHGVVLHVDHKVPLDWGGTNDLDNLQALCSECNEGKKAYYATYDEYAAEIRQAISYDEPQRRIGELLKAFNGRPVRGDLLERVASAKQHQEDWQKRLRELRMLGWKIKPDREKAGGRTVVSYRLLDDPPPWPADIRAAIRQVERERGYRSRK